MITTIGPALVIAIYLFTAAAFTREGRGGLALTYFAYALANVGLIWADWSSK